MKRPWSPGLGRYLLRHPGDAVTLARAGWRLRRQGWLRRSPFLPLPDARYWEFRLVTVNGGSDDRAQPGVDGRRRALGAGPAGGSLVSRVLLLNATFEPLQLVSERRAVVLMLAGRAEPIVTPESPNVCRSASLVVQIPAIVRLHDMVKLPSKVRTPPLTRRSLLLRDSYRCAYCLEHADTIDHVVPRSRGGRHEWTNVVAACRRHNMQKGDRLLEEIGMAHALRTAGARRAVVALAPPARPRPALGAVPAPGVVNLRLTELYDYDALRKESEADDVRRARAARDARPGEHAVTGDSRRATRGRDAAAPSPWRRRARSRSARRPLDRLVDSRRRPSLAARRARQFANGRRVVGRRACEPCVPGEVTVHDGPLEGDRAYRLVCFAGRGPGEVFVDGVKAVGVTQWRVREGMFVSTIMLAHRPATYCHTSSTIPDGLDRALDHHVLSSVTDAGPQDLDRCASTFERTLARTRDSTSRLDATTSLDTPSSGLVTPRFNSGRKLAPICSDLHSSGVRWCNVSPNGGKW